MVRRVACGMKRYWRRCSSLIRCRLQGKGGANSATSIERRKGGVYKHRSVVSFHRRCKKFSTAEISWRSVIQHGMGDRTNGLDDWLTVHRSITLANFQLDAQNSYLFIYNTFIKILYMFRTLPCSSSGGLGRNWMYAVSGIVTVALLHTVLQQLNYIHDLQSTARHAQHTRD